MSIYFIEAVVDGVTERYMLDATESISISHQGSVTSFPVEDGSEAGDNYSVKQPTITYSGGISDIKMVPTPEDSKSTLEYLWGIGRLRDLKVPLKFWFSESIPPIENCYLETFTFSQSTTNGVYRTPEGSVSSFKVTLVAKAVKKVEGLKTTTRREDSIVDPTDEKEATVSTTKYEDPNKTPPTYTQQGDAAGDYAAVVKPTNPGGILP